MEIAPQEADSMDIPLKLCDRGSIRYGIAIIMHRVERAEKSKSNVRKKNTL